MRSATEAPRSMSDLRAAAARAVAACRCRLGCSNISRPTGWRFRRPSLPRRRSSRANGGRSTRSPTRRPALHRDPSPGSCRRRAAAVDSREALRQALRAAPRRCDAEPSPPPSLSDVVARIERRRRSREPAHRRRPAPDRALRGRRRCSAGSAGRAARSPGSRARRAEPLIGRSIARAQERWRPGRCGGRARVRRCARRFAMP